MRHVSIIVTTDQGSPNTFLCTEKEYGDFGLQFEMMVMNGSLNSGVQILSKFNGENFGGRDYGPQVEIEDNGKNGSESGYIHGVGNKGPFQVKGKDITIEELWASDVFSYKSKFASIRTAVPVSCR